MRILTTVAGLALGVLLLGCGDQGTKETSTASGGNGATAGVVKAMATMEPTKGSKVKGTVTFQKDGDAVKIMVALEGLSPGKHGFHVHEKGDCSAPDGSSAGGHYNPTDQPHGAPSDEKRHVGDLGNVVADENGKVDVTFTDKVISLDGPYSIVGKSVIVHEGEDDLKSQPSGNAGPRAACGVIKAVEAMN
jgi:Cu-Zn family superoxide dismutase